jgi:hypothetical protein
MRRLGKGGALTRGMGLAGALAALAALSSCGFSNRIPWSFGCGDFDQIEPTPANAPSPSVVFEQIGSLKVMWSVTRTASPVHNTVRIEQSVDIPPYANQATVFLNGWQAAYDDTDHHLYDVAAILGRINVTPGQKISWSAIGALHDYDAKEAYTWTYRYTIVAWNSAFVNAMVDHTDAELHCKSGGTDGDDNFFEGENPGSTGATALASFPSFLRNGGFAGGRQVAVLPRGFGFSLFENNDHHLLQLAYNLESVAPFARHQAYHKARSTVDPLASSAAETERTNGEFVSWKTAVAMKDDSRRRDYGLVEFVSGMGGSDIEIVQPELSISPRDAVGGGSGVRGLKSADVVIENLPYMCAVPMLTGWDIGYSTGDQHVKDLGIWLDLLRYERPFNSPTGTLRYRVQSIMKDKDDHPDNYFRDKVIILGLKPTGVVVRPEGSLLSKAGRE